MSETELREALTKLVSFGTNMDDECVYCGFGPDDDAEHATDCPMAAAERALAFPAEPEQADEGLDLKRLALAIRAHFEEFHGDTLTAGCDIGIAAEYARLAPARDDTST